MVKVMVVVNKETAIHISQRSPRRYGPGWQGERLEISI